MKNWAFVYLYGVPPTPDKPYGIAGFSFPDDLTEADVVTRFKHSLEDRYPGSVLVSYAPQPETPDAEPAWRQVTQ